MLLRLLLSFIVAATVSPAQQPANDRAISWKELIPNILDDQKAIWSFPGRLAAGHYLIPSAAFAATATALAVGADPPEAHYFRNTTAFNGFNHALSSTATSAALLAAPLVLYGTGLVRKDSKMTRTMLLAGEAVADVEIVTAVV